MFLYDRCGVVGICSSEPVAPLLYFCLRALQHRGQECSGMAVYDESIKCLKGMGLIHEFFNSENLGNLKGKVGIAHNRYSTTGSSEIGNCQPILVSSSYGDIALGHNGDIVNSRFLREELQRVGWAFITTTDSEIIVRMLANELSLTGDIIKAMKNVMKKLVGSYSLALLVDNRVFGIRDPHGIKPLCLGKFEKGYVVASESVALDSIGAELIRDVRPGEMVELREDGIKTHQLFSVKNKAHCMFEYVYFSRPDSIIDGKAVYDVRLNIGMRLYEEQPVDADIICPVPDSGLTYAVGFSRASGITFGDGLMKNKYAWRTFILPYQKHRDLGVREKLNPIRSVLDGKRIVLVDDSIVRGTTMRKIVQMVRKAGAKEVHVRIGSPPIISPCYLGIDMTTRDQFIANQKSVPEIAESISADSLGYISVKGLVEAIGHRYTDLCLGCLIEEYPVPVPGEMLRFQKRLESY